MTKIENFISMVEREICVAKTSGVFPPDHEQERLVLERLDKKFPELNINPKLEQRILLHTRLALNFKDN